MNAKKLIEHTRNMLVQHELARMGIHAQDVKDELFKIADKAKRDLTQPIVVPEEDILAQYLAENKITAHNDRTFLTETFLGCVRHRKILERSDVQTTLRLFYEKTGGRYLQNEYYLFAVFCYLALWRLEELGFARFSKFVRCFDPVKMSRLIGFIFNPVNLETDLKQAWGKVLDHQFLKEHVIDPILRHISVAQKLLEEHCDRADYGMVPKKSDKKSTEIEPFLLTQPKPRKLPEPTEKMSMIVKANPVPKTLYEDSAEMRRLERIRDDNRAKVMKLYETAQKEQFKVAQRRPSDKVQQIREQIEQERKAKFERERVKSHKAVPQFVHQHVPVKLTTAAILREDALVRKQRREEEAVLAQAEVMVRDPAEFETWKEECRAKDDEERLLELERRRLEILMVHEDAYIARQDKIKENREKAAEVLAVKDEIKTISELQRRELEEENKKKIEEVHEIKDGIVKAKAKMLDDKSKMDELAPTTATEVILESQRLLEIAQREAEEERARKTELIQQIRLLEKSIPPVGTFQKDVDLTETSGIGLLGEMSVVELQERLVLAKLRHKDAEERRRAEITEHKAKRIEQITQKLQEIDMEREERKNRRLQRILPDRGLSVASVRSDRSQAESLKEAILERDPKLRSLQAKIEERKAARTIVGINRPLNMPARTPSAMQSKRQTPTLGTRPGTAMTEKWDDLDEAERMYVMQRRELRREQQTLLEEMARENISRTGAVPIVELKALRA
ncbi:hypothetical protein HK105_208661 [Polyrhizophydium stewartii]|uniref:Cilia- and flagella-associated protein 99 n=1 Tax=Polyrhizophydium stewartii TaxID=2732419 RepID=A0ABR4MX83_9FUNG